MDELDTRRERAAQNQAIFREVNERIAALSRRYASALQPSGYVCECFDTGCVEILELTPDQYELLRSSGTRFIVLPGHEAPAFENVVERTDQYVVVEKTGVGSEITAALNPRAEHHA